MAPPQVAIRVAPISHTTPEQPDQPFTVCSVQLQLTVFGPLCAWLSVALHNGAAPTVLGAITTTTSLSFAPFVSTTTLHDGSANSDSVLEHADGGWESKDSAVQPQQQFASTLGQRIVKKYRDHRLLMTVTCGVQGPLASMLIGDGATAPKASMLEFSGVVYRESCRLLEECLDLRPIIAQ